MNEDSHKDLPITCFVLFFFFQSKKNYCEFG